MIKDIINANESVLPNTKQIEVLKDNFPACFKEDGSFDIERFKEYLNDKLAITNEGYELKFLGKNYARLLASVDTTTVIVPDEEHNNKPENKDSQNIYISGDNLDGLKQLLKSYQGKVKCIYIDPPYNTGSDGFVYNDNFNFTVEELATKLSIDEEQANRILDLTKRGSASHSAWLTFMYPRLLLARDLLTEDGVIFISIDENEGSNLKLLCDDVFGEENYFGDIIWEATTQPINVGKAKFGFQQKTEPILFYAKKKKNIDGFILNEIESAFSYPHNGRFGKCRFEIIEKSNTGSYNRPTMTFPILGQCPRDGKRWQIGEEAARNLEASGKIEIVDGVVKKAIYPEDEIHKRQFEPFWSFFSANEYGSAHNGKEELNSLMGQSVGFDTVKPTKLIKKLLSYLGDNYYVVDFFSGSSTTADATMQLNNEDSGKRNFIMIQLPETISKDEDLYKSGYDSIDKLGIERIIRAAQKIRNENSDTSADLGFKHYTLKEPNPTTLDKLEKFVPDDQGLFLTNDILRDFGTQTVLTTWLVRDGYGFNADVKAIDFDGYTGYYIDKHLYLVDAEITKEAIAAIVDKYETDGDFNAENVVLFGYSFVWTMTEQLKINLARLKDTEKNLRINFDVRY